MSWAGTYRLVTRILQPVSGAILNKRFKQGKEDETRLDERRGIASRPRPAGQLIWMHGASVGETTMLLPLIQRLLDGDPALHILVTSGTVTSAEIMESRLPERAFHQYVPLDGPKFVSRFLDHWKPDLAIWAESEIWPNLVLQTKAGRAKMALINARLSETSLKGWQRKPRFAKTLFSAFDMIFAADEVTRDTLKTFSENVLNRVGNLKAAAPALKFDEDEAHSLSAAIGRRPVWLVASTHEPEEFKLLRAHAIGPGKKADALLIWMPRHPERGDDVAKLCADHEIAQRSKGQVPTDDTSIYIMDTLGEMGLALELADVVFVAGSLHHDLTGHNPLEAARARVPVLTGPHVASFTHIYEDLINHNAAMRVTTADQLGKTVMALLIDRAAARQMARRAYSLAKDSDNVLDHTIARLRGML